MRTEVRGEGSVEVGDGPADDNIQLPDHLSVQVVATSGSLPDLVLEPIFRLPARTDSERSGPVVREMSTSTTHLHPLRIYLISSVIAVWQLRPGLNP